MDLNKEDILNLYRHSKGLFRAAEKLARDFLVIRCHICREFHPMESNHVAPTVVVKEEKK